MFGNAKSAFTALGGELRLRPSAAPSAFMSQAPAAPAPSSPVPGPVSASLAPAVVPAPAPAAAPAPVASGIPHQTQVLIGGLLAGAAILGTILFSD